MSNIVERLLAKSRQCANLAAVLKLMATNTDLEHRFIVENKILALLGEDKLSEHERDRIKKRYIGVAKKRRDN